LSYPGSLQKIHSSYRIAEHPKEGNGMRESDGPRERETSGKEKTDKRKS
jgi:hypothetical protein